MSRCITASADSALVLAPTIVSAGDTGHELAGQIPPGETQLCDTAHSGRRE